MKFRDIFLYGVWFAVMLGGIGILITRFNEYGLWGAGALIMGAGMMITVFTLLKGGKKGVSGQEVPAGDVAMAMILAGVMMVLLVSFISAAVNRNLGSSIILLVFIIGFTNVTRDWIRHIRTRRWRKKSAGGEDTE